MSKTVTISDDLAALLEARSRAAGRATIDSVAESLTERGPIAETDEDRSTGRSDDALRALIDEAEASGAAEPWDAAAARAEILRRYRAGRHA